MEFSYDLIFDLYDKFPPEYLQGKEVSRVEPEWRSRTEDEMERIYHKVYKEVVEQIFGASTQLDQEEFIRKMQNSHRKDFLRPHELRKRVLNEVLLANKAE